MKIILMKKNNIEEFVLLNNNMYKFIVSRLRVIIAITR